MGTIKYDAGSFAAAISLANNLCREAQSASSSATAILNGINPPEGLNISGMIASMISEINRLAARAQEVISTITSMKSQIEQTDANIAKQINDVLEKHNQTVELRNKMRLGVYGSGWGYIHWNVVHNLDSDDMEYIKENMHDILYNSKYTDTYGGSQEKPLLDYLDDDRYIEKIVKSYFPKMTNEELVDYLTAITNSGCGYTAVANYIIESYSNKPEQFEKDYGFPIAYKNKNGDIITSVNYLLVDLYCYANKNGLNKGTVHDVYNSNELNYAYKNNIFPNIYPGGLKTRNGTSQSERFDILVSEKFSNDNLFYFIENPREYGKEVTSHGMNTEDIEKITKQLSSGGVVELSASDFTLYYTDKNGNIDNSINPEEYIDAPHTMTITGINENGDFLISTWGKEYILDNSSIGNNYGYARIKFY